jgi:hydrogenase-4 component F
VAGVLFALVAIPFLAAVASWFLPVSGSRSVTVVSGAATFALSLRLVPAVIGHVQLAADDQLRADPLSVVFLVATAFVYLATTLFSVGYLRLEPGAAGTRYGRRFHAGLNLFCWAMVVAPLVNGLALLWVAVEITTVVSALLVAIDDTDGATEAAWKYILIASLGLGIALLATIVMYYAGSTVFGAGYNVLYPKMLAGAHRFPPDVVRLAFVLSVLGYGTKMGLVPVHTWLPDAHSEAPTPISALLSGALLATSFYAILRYYQITVHAVGSTYPRNVLLVFGVASLVLAAFYVLRQRDMKRMLAYSSIEHMGILSIGMSFGVTLAVVGVLLHVLAHAAGKATAFFGAGSVIRKFGTKDMTEVRGGVGALPWSGPMLVAAILALSAFPPFGVFRSEFLIVSGGLSDPRYGVTAVLIVLVTVAFLGLSWSTTRTLLTPGQLAAPGARAEHDHAAAVVPAPDRGETSWWIVAAMVLGLAGLVLLGVHPPADLSALLRHAAGELEGSRR